MQVWANITVVLENDISVVGFDVFISSRVLYFTADLNKWNVLALYRPAIYLAGFGLSSFVNVFTPFTFPHPH